MATVSWPAFWSTWSDDSAERGFAVDLWRSDNISDALACLHWLRVPERIKFKIAVLTCKMVHTFAPGYLSPFTVVADLPSRRSLRSVGTNRLVVPINRLSTVGSRAFLIAGSQTWNDVPEDVTSAESLTSSRHTFFRIFKVA